MREREEGWIHEGTVIDVSDKFIDFKLKGKEESKKLSPHTLLASGRVVNWVKDPMCYLLEDVKKGDEVGVGVGTMDPREGEVCFFVIIRKRPGGKVPPTRKITYTHPYHRDKQAENDYEEFGTPLPKHLLKDAKYLKAPPQMKAADPPIKKD